ncbi:roundabout homolog 1 [Spodoptera frugiperda]|uniref:Hemolin n=1 Tax=Spodoptera frugiperda TaxID=7108 RepID=A0A9R0E8V8_SPOFR|nr:roundabout homolog 1 [Spodoptera frugiperda]XP_035431499.2 roundabout homolog 1 [Spodoptera frugiperda]XP_050561461.1 roundabout homolog 1 [Spodoptera frugiperda]XP_050561462.1 roundabout homolog 1 [Spodoptera frugiperda]
MDILTLVTSLLGLICFCSGPVNGGMSDDYVSTGEAPYIIEQPIDVTVARHQPATLNCRAGGSPPPTIRWYKGGVLVVSDTHRSLLPAGGLFFLRTTHGRAHSDAGVYWCEATNPYGTARSRNATLHVAVLREEFRLEPVSTQSAQGETVILECSPPRGSPEPTVYWKKNGQMLHFDGDSRMHLVDGGNLVIQDARQTDAGRYQCIARNAAGTRESAVATLRIHIKPYLITGPEDVVAQTGGSVTFQCRVGGDPLPDVLWRRTAGGGNMPLGRVKVLDDRSLRLDNVILGDEGEYACEADNSVGAVSASGYLTVYDPPSITLKPNSVNIETGTMATFTCSATGRPEPTMFWSIEGNRTIIFPGTSRGKYHATTVLDGVTVLTINDTNKNDSGNTIVCSAVNFAGSSFVRGKLTVTSDDDRPPPIITNGPSNQTLPIKSMAVFPCTAVGTPEPIIAWYFEGEALIQNHRRNVTNDGTLILKDLDKIDSGTYTCVASSHHGKYVWSGVLLVDSPINPNIHFFRAADVSSLPGPPTKPLIHNVTETSVTITWNQNNKIGSSSILGYQVEVFSRETLSGSSTPRNSRGWVVLARRVYHTQFVAKSLVPGVTYMFIVRTENSHGLSGPSPVSDAVTVGDDASSLWESGVFSNNTEFRNNILTDNIVELIEATPIDSKTIKLMWEILNFYYLEGLFIYFRPQDNITTEYEMKTILHSNDVSGYEITSLRKYTKYEFFLIPFYKKFEGKPSNSRVAQTLDDVPDGPPINIEMFILNTTTVHLKWSPPEAHLQNGIITGYNVLVNWLDIPANKSMVAINTTVHQATSLIMTNLTSGVSYSVQIAAETIVGLGPFSQKVYLNIDSRSVGLDPLSRYPINGEVSIVAGDFVMETWFYFLIGAIVLFKIIVIGGIIYVRKHNIFAKKSALPNIYDSNGTSLVTQMNIKAAVSLSHPLSSCYNKNTVTKTESLLWMENQPGLCMSGTQTSQSKEKTNSEYDKVTHQLPEYAEVTSSRANANEWNTSKTATSPAAYASVTLVANTRQCVSSLGWFPPTGKNVDSFDNRYAPEEEMYPASNGGYYNRNVYSEKYFQGHPNVLKFYDLPSLEKTQKAQIRYNQSLDDRKGDKNSKTDATQSLIGRTYGISSRKNSESESTYRAFGEDETDEENYPEDGGYDELQAMQPQRQRPQHQYERPNFDNDATRTLARLTSFRQGQGLPGSAKTTLAPTHPPPAPHPRVDSVTR